LAAPVAPEPPPRWRRPVAIGSGVVAAVLGGLAMQQGLAARSAWAEADAMVLPGGIYRPGATPGEHRAALARGDAASRNAWIAGGGAAVSAAACGVLLWLSREPGAGR
jgi:hypothetical protein